MPDTIVHVGGHHAEELDDYLAAGWGAQFVLWVEAMDDAAAEIRSRIAHLPHHRVAPAVVWSESGQQMTFHVTSNGQSSSVLKLKTHSDHYPEIVVTREHLRTTSTLFQLLMDQGLSRIDLLNLDIQGAELEALKGLGAAINHVGAIYSEINTEELYEGCALLPDLDAWLARHSFVRVETELTAQGWGDALWIRHDQLPTFWRVRKFQREAPRHLRRARGSLLAWGSRTLRPRAS